MKKNISLFFPDLLFSHVLGGQGWDGIEEKVPIVYVEWESRVNFVTIFGDLYQNKLWGICTNLNQFNHLISASGSNDDVIKMAAKLLLMQLYK